MAYFPAFIKMEGASVLIVGGGRAAARKIEVLLDFGAKITVIALHPIEKIRQNQGIHLSQKEFEENDLQGMDVVVAATERKELNHEIAEACKLRNIPVNAVDQIEDCTFIFPSYIKKGNVVTAISSSGKSPVVAQYLKEKFEPFMTEELIALTEYLGSLREMTRNRISTEALRKAFYQEVLAFGVDEGRSPNEEELEKIYGRHQIEQE